MAWTDRQWELSPKEIRSKVSTSAVVSDPNNVPVLGVILSAVPGSIGAEFAVLNVAGWSNKSPQLLHFMCSFIHKVNSNG